MEQRRRFVRYIISQHGIPTTLTSDQDPKFTGKFWKEFMSLLGTKLAMSSAYHPQTDGQTERLNQIVEQLLRAACKDDISKWDLHLPVLEFAYNNATPTYIIFSLLQTQPASPTETDSTSHTSWKIHNAFHVQLLKPYHDPNTIFTGCQPLPPPPVLVHNEPEYEVESVLAHRCRQNGNLKHLICWKGYDPSDDS
ncbi:hypothetical protein CLOP_g20450 [Closterium sp. NIES-67]|nr:hypothetical protein CLOP_g20450 [Closterium sp. NIES-67]